MDYAFLGSTISLVIQFAVFAILMVSLWLKNKKRFRQHGLLMVTSVVLHLFSLFIVMTSSFRVIVSAVNVSETILALSFVHGVFGLVALFLGVWLSVAWRFRQSLQYCAPKKNLMRATFLTWTLSIFVGTVLYLIFYLPLIV
jgi:uncharacterized membrane protein YozB (DUF420 family)